jgi:DNA-binding MarR family transcriptional regulator
MAPYPKGEDGLPDTSKPRTNQRIKRVIKNLIEAGLIKSGNYNKTGYDRTAWYTLTEQGENLFNSINCTIHGSKMNNGKFENEPPIPKEYTEENKEEKIKLHSPQSSEEDFQGETQEDFSSQKGQEEIQVEEKKNTNPYQLTDSDMNLLKSYQKGFIEEIDKVAKVKYDKKLIHLCKTFNLLNKDRELLKAIYIYFRTYRDHFGTYTTEIRSFKALNEKIEKLQAEMIRETKRVIKESGSVVLHQDKEKKIAVIYKSDSMKKDDKNRIDDFKRIGYTVFDMYKTIGHIELKDLGYHVQHVY